MTMTLPLSAGLIIISLLFFRDLIAFYSFLLQMLQILKILLTILPLTFCNTEKEMIILENECILIFGAVYSLQCNYKWHFLHHLLNQNLNYNLN